MKEQESFPRPRHSGVIARHDLDSPVPAVGGSTWDLRAARTSDHRFRPCDCVVRFKKGPIMATCRSHTMLHGQV
jgi:hypothetical protein